MFINSTNNKDVVRVASNNTHSQFIFETGPDKEIYGDALYKGNEYRSVIFDVAHYRPFRFAAQVQVADENGNNPEITPASDDLLSNEVDGDQEENVDEVMLSYKPGQQVDILLDITSFQGSDNRSVHPFGQIFGEEFEVYIDAPMLEIDQDRLGKYNLTPDKLRQDPSNPGRFIYTVSKTREQERTFGFEPAYNKDLATSRYDDYGGVVPNVTIDQTGERKRLPFKKSAITSKGDITITSNKEKVVFWDKTFKVKTEHLKGILKYKKADGTELPVPDDAFIAFVRLRTNARIGVVTLNPDTGGPGEFELNLRDEYRFDWEDDPIDFYYKDKETGKVYNFNYIENGEKKTVDLNKLYELLQAENPVIVLTEQN
jgi:ribosomal protein L21E